MHSAAEQALSFRSMHVKGDPLILVNVGMPEARSPFSQPEPRL